MDQFFVKKIDANQLENNEHPEIFDINNPNLLEKLEEVLGYSIDKKNIEILEGIKNRQNRKENSEWDLWDPRGPAYGDTFRIKANGEVQLNHTFEMEHTDKGKDIVKRAQKMGIKIADPSELS